MCHATISRTDENGKTEYLKQDGDWTDEIGRAHEVSEEDAKVFVRMLEKERGRTGSYEYDYKPTVDEPLLWRPS